MQRDPQALANAAYDVLVIGAGITGAWVALDCARRGLRVALVDKGDFGAATSSKSSGLLHGGICHLQQLQFRRARELAQERACYHLVAPHLSHFLPFIVPTYGALKQGKMLLRAGLVACRALGADANRVGRDSARPVPRAYTMSRAAVLARLPLAEVGLTGAVVFYASHMTSSERMTLAVVASAARAGATVANYVRVDSYLQDARCVWGARVTDLETAATFDIRARLVVNAVGPWIGSLNRGLTNAANEPTSTGFSQGSHLVTRQLIADYAVALPAGHAGRPVFILPWRGYSLIGPSCEPAECSPDCPAITGVEIDQLLAAVHHALLGTGLTRADIVASFSGIYPLREAMIRNPVYQSTGEYQLIDHLADEGREGLITARGEKFTTARLLAEQAADLVVQRLAVGRRLCRTRTIPLASAAYASVEAFYDDCATRYADLGDAAESRRLAVQYGTDIAAMATIARADAQAAAPVAADRPNRVAEVIYAVQAEMAVRLEDVVLRRTGMGTIGIPAAATLERCAALMGERLGWDAARRSREVAALERLRPATGAP